MILKTLFEGAWTEEIDTLIRIFFYILIFWLPYSSAVVESCVIVSVCLWLFKRTVIFLNGERSFKVFLRSFRPVNSYLDRTIAFFMAVSLVSVFSSILLEGSFKDYITKLMEWFAIYWLVLEAFREKKQIRLLLFIGIFSAFCVSLDALSQYFWIGRDIFNGHLISPDGRATASFRAPSGLGTYSAVFLPIVLSLMLSGKYGAMNKILFLFAFISLMLALILTFTRGAWTAGFVAMAFLFFSILIFKKHAEIFKTILLAGIFLGIITVFPLLLNTQGTLKMLKRSNTVSWRLMVWKDSLKMVQDRPLFGHGFNTYMPIFQAYRRDPKNYPTYAHNSYVQLAAEVGLLGLAGFLWLHFKLFISELKRIRFAFEKNKEAVVLSLGLLGGMLAFMIHGFFDTNLYSLQLAALYSLNLGLVVRSGQLIQQENERERK